MEESTRRSTNQTNLSNPKYVPYIGVDKGAEEGDRTVIVITIQDLVIYCATHNYPLTARIAVDIEDGDDFDVTIEGVHGHGHDDPETLILKVVKHSQETRSKGSCESCADTDCRGKSLPQRVCEGYIDNRNYPINRDTDRERERERLENIKNTPMPAIKACCGNCAKRLQLKGCSRYTETHNDGCCIDHKFLSEGASK